MAEVLKKFGRYFLLDQIAQGGMAEIYRARLAARDGAGRLLVIKRVQAGFGSNAEFQQMFKAEIKVTMGFNHPNVVQLYDYGEEQSQPYIAMEYVEGKNLRQFGNRFGEQKQVFPVDFATYVIEQAAAGLHYAHTYKDKISGKPSNIVHRDISPQNIMISYDGNVKVIDFGIAKATTNSEATRAGVIKGKPSYLSPEQISGDTLDGRCDIFALGTVLWELLVGKKLFQGESDLAILKQIEAAHTFVKPPSQFNPKVPKELDYIVLRALAKHREKRFQTAEEFQRALHKFLYSFNPDFNPSDVSYYARDLFKNEIVEDRKQIQKLNDKVEQVLAIEHATPEEVKTPRAAPQAPEDSTTVVTAHTTVAPEKKGSGSREAFDADSLKSARVEIELDPKAMASRRPNKEQVDTTGSYNTGFTHATRSRTATYSTTKTHARPSGSGWLFKLAFVGGGAAAAIALFFGQALGPKLGFSVPGGVAGKPKPAAKAPADRATASLPQLPDAPPAETMPGGRQSIILKLSITPWSSDGLVMLNGRPMNPSIGAPAPLDEPLELVIEKQGFSKYKNEFVIHSTEVGMSPETTMSITLAPIRFGKLSVRMTPSADVIIEGLTRSDGQPWRMKTPFEDEVLPVDDYNIRIVNEVLGLEKVKTVSIKDGKHFKIDETFED